MDMKKSAGILLGISSLPSPYGIGCFDKSAYDFVDFLAYSGQTYWQILPLGQTGYGDSPYQSFSTFAGNPYLIDLGDLINRGWLTVDECRKAGLDENGERVDYQRQYTSRLPLLQMAYERSDIQNTPDYKAFCASQTWLDDYALFMAIKDHGGSASFMTWERDILHREPQAMERYRQKLSPSVGFYAFIQYMFHIQWKALKAYANAKGVFIIGDLPIYVSLDSADVWESRHLFSVDEDFTPKAVAGCPPDGFSPDGQVWGNPLYDWEAHKREGFAWWRARLSHALTMYDILRIDHFRGFDAYYAIPYGQSTAHGGHWESGPGMALFDAVRDICQGRVIAEDLGYMTPSVAKLLHDSGFPGMRVLQFGFDARDGQNNDHLPSNYPSHCVAYTGTHDNQTLYSWYQTITEAERAAVYDYIGGGYPKDEPPVKRLIATLMRSDAMLCIVPMQDWLERDDASRMNIPSTTGGNWQWRMCKEDINHDLAEEILQMTRVFDRESQAKKGDNA